MQVDAVDAQRRGAAQYSGCRLWDWSLGCLSSVGLRDLALAGLPASEAWLNDTQRSSLRLDPASPFWSAGGEGPGAAAVARTAPPRRCCGSYRGNTGLMMLMPPRDNLALTNGERRYNSGPSGFGSDRRKNMRRRGPSLITAAHETAGDPQVIIL